MKYGQQSLDGATPFSAYFSGSLPCVMPKKSLSGFAAGSEIEFQLSHQDILFERSIGAPSISPNGLVSLSPANFTNKMLNRSASSFQFRGTEALISVSRNASEL
jgi:hypothetical protein